MLRFEISFCLFAYLPLDLYLSSSLVSCLTVTLDIQCWCCDSTKPDKRGWRCGKVKCWPITYLSREKCCPFYIRGDYLQLLNPWTVCNALLLQTDALSSAPFICVLSCHCASKRKLLMHLTLWWTHQTRQDLIRMECSITIIWQNFSVNIYWCRSRSDDSMNSTLNLSFVVASFAERERPVLLR